MKTKSLLIITLALATACAIGQQPRVSGIPVQSVAQANTTSNVLRDFVTGFVITNNTFGQIVTRSNPANVLAFGALGNGVADDTAAVKAAYDSLGTNGGTIFFPLTHGFYRFNLLVTNDNVAIEGNRVNDTTLTLTSFKPADLTKPVIQVGNDSGYVFGFNLRNVSINGTVGSDNSPGCLYLFGGAIESAVLGCSFYNGADTVKMHGGTNYPVTLISFDNCNFWEGTNSTIYCLRPTNINGYVTGIYLSGCHVNGHNTSGFAVRLDRTKLSSVNTYYDLNDDHAVWIKNGGLFRGQNVELEAHPTGAGLITVSDDSVHDPCRFLVGTVSTLGTIKYQDGTSETIPNGEIFSYVPLGYIQTPYIRAPLYITGIYDPFSTSNSIDQIATGGPIKITCGNGLPLQVTPGIDVKDGNAIIRRDISIYGGNAEESAVITAYGPDGGLNLEARGTNQSIRLVPSGNGFVWSISNLLVGGDVVAQRDVALYGANLAQAGQFTANSADGGVAIIALGTNQSIRLAPTGTGRTVTTTALQVGGNVYLDGHWLSNDGQDEGIFVSTNGNVGINESSPSAALHVFGDAIVTAGIQLQNVTASRAVITDANSRLTNASVTTTELSYLSGITGPLVLRTDGTATNLSANANASTAVPLTVNHRTGSTNNVFEVRDTNGTLFAMSSSNGNFAIGSAKPGTNVLLITGLHPVVRISETAGSSPYRSRIRLTTAADSGDTGELFYDHGSTTFYLDNYYPGSSTLGSTRFRRNTGTVGSPILTDTVTLSGLGNVGVVTNAPAAQLHVNGSVAIAPTNTINLTADNTTVSTVGRSYLKISSDSVVFADRTFILTAGSANGHMLKLHWVGTNTGELVDDSAAVSGNHRLSATWIPTQYDSITLTWDGTDWIEDTRSTN